MDAGKINSLTHGLRPNIGGSHAGPSPGDAAFAAKVAAVVVLDDLLQASEDDPRVAPGIVAALPLALKTGVIVNLSTGSVAAEMAARLGSAMPHAGENRQPNPTSPGATPAAHIYALAERLGDVNRGNIVASGAALSVLAEDKRGSGVAAPSPALAGLPNAGAIETRNEMYAFAPAPIAVSPRPEAVEQRSGVAAAIEQARNSERLAGLHANGAVEVPPRWFSLERLVLGALALGVLLVLFL